MNKISITQFYTKILPKIVEDIEKLEIWRSGAKQASLSELQSSSKNYRVTRKDVSNVSMLSTFVETSLRWGKMSSIIWAVIFAGTLY